MRIWPAHLCAAVAVCLLCRGRAAGEAAPYVKKDTALATWQAWSAATHSSGVAWGPWQVLGPFDSPAGGMQAALPPEQTLDLKAVYKGKHGRDIRWQPNKRLDEGSQSSIEFRTEDKGLVAYAHRVITSDAPRAVAVWLDTEDGFAAFLNGEKAVSHDAPRRYGGEKVVLNLKAGANGLLLKFCPRPTERSFRFRFRTLADVARDEEEEVLRRIQSEFPQEQMWGVLVEHAHQAQYTQLRELMADKKHWEFVAPTAYRKDALILETDRDPADVVLRRTEALLRDLRRLVPDRGVAEKRGVWPRVPRSARPTVRSAAGAATGASRLGEPAVAQAEAELARLRAECDRTDVKDTERRRALCLAACRLRRQIAFANPLLNFGQLLFVKRHRPGAAHMCDQYHGFQARPGGGLCVLSDPFGPSPSLRNVLENSVVERGRLKGKPLTPGCFVSPDLSYDARTILFAYTELGRGTGNWCPERSYHVFRINADGTGLEQLTDGPWNEFDPCWLPNGRIAFISERRGGYGRCHPRPVPIYTLFGMNPDGTDIRCLSYHESNEWQPSVNHDGLIVYTRWDYVDRHFNIAHHPWLTTPDGRDARALHGNFPKNGQWQRRPQMEMDVRAIPGSRKYVATGAPHHHQGYGSLAILDPETPDDDAMGPVRRLTPDLKFPESEVDPSQSQAYGTAWPLSEDYFLCAYANPSVRRSERHGLYLVDSFGNRELVYEDPAIGCVSPIPLRPTPRPPIVPELAEKGPDLPPEPPITDPKRMNAAPPSGLGDQESEGSFVVVDVYDSIQPWPAGTKIVALRVIQILPKSTAISAEPQRNYIGGLNGGVGRTVLGTVPVEEDGSVHFRAPIHKPLYFQALDSRGLAVQSMRSSTYLQQGERLTCQGCHEPRRRAPQQPPKTLMALRRGPSDIQPDVDGSNPFSYPRLVQPVLDRTCLPCHTKNPDKAPDLRGFAGLTTQLGKADRSGTQWWYPSYKSFQRYAYIAQLGESITYPGRFGARASKLFQMLEKGHHDVKLSGEDLRRLTLWLDCDSDFYGAFEDPEAQARGQIVRPSLE